MIAALSLSALLAFTPANGGVDDYLDAIPAAETRTVSALGAQIKGISEDREVRLQAAFRWIARNIRYDYEGLASGNAVRDAQGCLNARKAVCQGIADLLTALGREIDVPVETVRGDARKLSWRNGEPVSTYDSHAWNRVRFGSRTYWFDPTWSVGQTREDPVTSGYWKLTPKAMGLSHIVDESCREPGDPSYARDALERSPTWHPGLARTANIAYPNIPAAVRLNSSMPITVRKTGPSTIVVDVIDGGTTIYSDLTLSVPDRESNTFIFAPQHPGWYTVRIFGWSGRRNGYPMIAEFPVHVVSIRRPIKLPKSYSSLDEYSVRVIRGFEGTFAASTEADISVDAPGASKLVLIKVGDSSEPWRDLTHQSGSRWDYRGRLSAGRWALCRNDPSASGRVTFLLEYQVTE